MPAPPVATQAQTNSKSDYGLGRKAPAARQHAVIPTAVTIRSNLPSSTDYSSMLPTVIGNQGHQGSCVAWATGYYYKSFQEEKKNNWSVNTTSHQYSPAFIYNQINGGSDSGSDPGSAMYLFENKGADTLADFPYNQNDYTTQPTPAQLTVAANYKASSDSYLFSGAWVYGSGGAHIPGASAGAPIDPLREHLADGDIFVLGIPVYHEFDGAQNNSTYVITHNVNASDTPRGLHEITIVGYDDNKAAPDGTKGAFKMVNQWGAGWGNAGYSWLSYSFVRDFGLDANASTNRSQLNFVANQYPAATMNAGTANATLTFQTNRSTEATIKVNGTTVATTSSFATSYSLPLTSVAAGTDTIVVTITDQNGEYTSATSSLVVPLLVTNPTDTGVTTITGSLSSALTNAKSGDTIVVNLPNNATTITLQGSLPVMATGVTLKAATCGQPQIVLDGSSASASDNGLTLAGNDTIIGLKVTKFRGRLLILKGTGNVFKCSTFSKT